MMSTTIKLNDKYFRPMLSAAQIEEATSRVAELINRDYADSPCPIVLGVLNGSFIFMSDLVRKFDFRCELSFVKLSSYSGTTSSGKVRELIGLNNNIAGRDVIIVEDIVDTGVSINHSIEMLYAHGAARVKVCTLFYKPEAYRGAATIDYIAMNIGNEFIVGYGLDYDELGRELKDIYVVTEGVDE